MEIKSLKNYYNIEKKNYDDKIILLNEKFELLTDHETANISLKSKLSDKENELHLLKLELNKMSDIKYEFEQLIKEKDNTYNEMKEQLYAKGITIRQLESDISLNSIENKKLKNNENNYDSIINDKNFELNEIKEKLNKIINKYKLLEIRN